MKYLKLYFLPERIKQSVYNAVQNNTVQAVQDSHIKKRPQTIENSCKIQEAIIFQQTNISTDTDMLIKLLEALECHWKPTVLSDAKNCNPSSCVVWILYPVVKRTSLFHIINSYKTRRWDYKPTFRQLLLFSGYCISLRTENYFTSILTVILLPFTSPIFSK